MEPDALYADLIAAQAPDRPRQAALRQDFRRVFLGDAAGKRVLHTILAWSHLYRSSVVDGDAHATHVLEGERSIGLKLLAMLIVESGEARASNVAADRAGDPPGDTD